MRQIKFRLWDSKNNCWYEPTFEAYRGKVEEVMISPRGRLTMRTMTEFVDESMFPDRFELMQFTGLHDKNGLEIYEGDIIEGVFGSRHEVRRNERPKGYKHIGKVGIVDGSVVFWPRPVENGRRMNYPGVPLTGGQRKYIYDDEIAGAESTVLGNIYENPEMLEVAEHE